MRLARRPTANSRRRLVGIDVARCLALLGMMATHMLPGYVGDEIPWPQQLAGGRASALFAVLAGVSIALMTGRQDPPRGRERAALSTGLAMRALVIATLGLALGDLRSGVAVILTYYGLLFVLGLPFLGLRSRALFVLAAGWLVVAPVLGHLLRPALLFLPTLTAGGDTPCHVPTAAWFHERLLPSLRLHGWYPGAYLGHPLLLYYFPLPFLVMSALAAPFGLPVAFKLGTALPPMMAALVQASNRLPSRTALAMPSGIQMR